MADDMEGLEIHVRIREERMRLGYRSQSAFAREIGIDTRTENMYEVGKSLPGLRELLKMQQIGADAIYILSGRRLPSEESGEGDITPPSPHHVALYNEVAALDVSAADVDLLLTVARRLARRG
ncbi:MAG: helix-turn-helix transcriptional regulator [Betaproteobacteria bacterium]|nr:helix-turn-helix transcriptional regulator [Betaproteobacteria bacterium]